MLNKEAIVREFYGLKWDRTRVYKTDKESVLLRIAKEGNFTIVVHEFN
jgi:hypothetical protein